MLNRLHLLIDGIKEDQEGGVDTIHGHMAMRMGDGIYQLLLICRIPIAFSQSCRSAKPLSHIEPFRLCRFCNEFITVFEDSEIVSVLSLNCRQLVA